MPDVSVSHYYSVFTHISCLVAAGNADICIAKQKESLKLMMNIEEAAAI